MQGSQLPRAFVLTGLWTLGLLFLGSVVHATESSLACPDWPTCYGSMLPEMEGGVFWEHLHRLVAGGLILIFAGATYLAWRERGVGSAVVKACFVGLALLLVQAVLGGITVIYLLPDGVSTSHLLAAYLFLGLTVGLALVTSTGWGRREVPDPEAARSIWRWGMGASVLVILQSGLGAWVRHADAGMACPGIPLCLGEWVPPLAGYHVTLQYFHRVLGMLVLVAVAGMAWTVVRRTALPRFRRLAWSAVVVVVAQITLGFLSVTTVLAVIPVSLHTLMAAVLFGLTVALATLSRERPAAGDGDAATDGKAGSGAGGSDAPGREAAAPGAS